MNGVIRMWKLLVMVLAMIVAAPLVARAGEPVAVMPLWAEKAPAAKGEAEADKPTLSIYLPPAEKATGTGIVVCPGGGYGALALGHEGKDVADWLNANGIAAFVLKYRIAPYRHPVPMHDAQRAMRIARTRAKEWNVNPERIGILGFSAGGHLASTVATHFDAGDSSAADPIDRASCRPDFAVLIYPVISLQDPTAHKGSRNNLLGPNADPKLVEQLSNHLQVTDKTPPTFLVHSRPDKAVPLENSILFHEALKARGVATELIVFETGGHGYGLAPKDPQLGTWPGRCIQWLKQQKMVVGE